MIKKNQMQSHCLPLSTGGSHGGSMRKDLLALVVGGSLLTAGCATDQGNYWDMKKVRDFDNLNLSFRADGTSFERTAAERNQSRTGWIESGTWRADRDGDRATVWVFVATLYDKAFMKKNIRKIQDVARSVSGDSFLEFGSDGRIKSNSGDIDYVFYRASGQPCVLIRKYWSDPRLASDMLRAVALEWVAGTHLIYAYHCRNSGPDLESGDMDILFDGISARNIVWPEDMFVNSDEEF